ncbi:uncharacterized protein [Periplaneta americana]|uniref:uncharacterized protein n=1 Tax=Periplaneta americana TaxID=6978 RepID=UPI0037E95A87
MQHIATLLFTMVIYSLTSGLQQDVESLSDIFADEFDFQDIASAPFGLGDFMPHHTQGQSRVFRSADMFKKQQCCNIAHVAPSKRAKTKFSECTKEVTENSPENAKKRPIKRFVCFGDCFARKYDLVDAEGYLVLDKLMPFVKNATESGMAYSEKEEVVKRCTDFSRFCKDLTIVDYYGKKCNMAALLFAQCMKVMSEVNCPDDKKVKSEFCDLHREHLTEKIEIAKI